MKVSLSDLYQTQDRDNSLDNSGDNSPSSTTFGTFIISSSKRSRRAIQKRVVTVPIKDVEASRFKGDLTLPSDSWSWRKYGQKPIKGSPYPRGYYRCSSSKGCPARKQVERSRSDPSLIVITYSYDHNHTWQTSRNRHQNRHTTTTSISPTAITATTTTTPLAPSTNPKIDNNQNHLKLENIDHHHQHKHEVDTCEEHMEPPLATMTDDLGWFAANHHHEDHPFLTSCNINDLDMAKIFPVGQEEEELFADLGELPECSAVFCQAAAPQGGQMGPRWCGTTS